MELHRKIMNLAQQMPAEGLPNPSYMLGFRDARHAAAELALAADSEIESLRAALADLLRQVEACDGTAQINTDAAKAALLANTALSRPAAEATEETKRRPAGSA